VTVHADFPTAVVLIDSVYDIKEWLNFQYMYIFVKLYIYLLFIFNIRVPSNMH